MDEVLTQQGTLDRVNEKAQALLATNADAKTSHAITTLTTRYQGVVAMSKVRFIFSISIFSTCILNL